MRPLIWQHKRPDGTRDTTWSLRLLIQDKLRTFGGFRTEALARAAERLITEAIQAGDFQFIETLRKRHDYKIGDILETYRAAHCPDRSGRPRLGSALAAELHNLETLLPWWTDKSITTQHAADRQAYWTARRASVTRGTGDRSTELELTTLNNALHWAWRRGDLRELPRDMRATFRKPADIAHARDFMPACGDELHAIASHLFQQREDELYAWAALLAAFTGLREEELQRLLAHPQRVGITAPPGWYDCHALAVSRAKRGINPEVLLDDPQRPHIRPLLDRLRAWHAARFPAHVYLLPGQHQSAPFTDGYLTRRLQAAAAALGLPARHAHGLRAYYATARLAQGTIAAQVAFELGQKSGDQLVREIYGDTPPQWRGLDNVFTWLPNTAGNMAGWETFQSSQQNQPANIVSIGSI